MQIFKLMTLSKQGFNIMSSSQLTYKFKLLGSGSAMYLFVL